MIPPPDFSPPQSIAAESDRCRHPKAGAPSSSTWRGCCSSPPISVGPRFHWNSRCSLPVLDALFRTTVGAWEYLDVHLVSLETAQRFGWRLGGVLQQRMHASAPSSVLRMLVRYNPTLVSEKSPLIKPKRIALKAQPLQSIFVSARRAQLVRRANSR